MNRRRALITAFTLIELLIVVAIIAILAAIAVPNFLESQVRAKVSRARADLRTIATALESYAVDYNTYPPNDGKDNVIPVELTTPVAYISSARIIEPFPVRYEGLIERFGTSSRFYTYTKIVTIQEAAVWTTVGRLCPNEAIDHWSKNLGAFEKYGKWRLVSNGPDRSYTDPNDLTLLHGCDTPYDPTNGTISVGNILRTQRDSQGRWQGDFGT